MNTATILCVALIIVMIVGMCYIAGLLDQRARAYTYVEKRTGLSREILIRAGRGEIE